MARFLTGVLIGCMAAGITYAIDADAVLALVFGSVSAALTWCGAPDLLFPDN
jgi:hypothetical protein